MQNTDEGRNFIKQSLSYFFWKWPYRSEVIKMDSPEALKNKGYETFGEHFFNAGVEKGAEQERKKNEVENAARDKKIAEYLRSKGVPEDVISGGFALK